MIKELLEMEKKPPEGPKRVWEWTMSKGWCDFYSKERQDQGVGDLGSALSPLLGKAQLRSIRALVLKDSHHFINNATVIAALKTIAMARMSEAGIHCAAVFIVTTRRVIPPELEHFISLFEIPAPDKEEILERLRNEVPPERHGSEEDLNFLAEALRGLTNHQITHLAQRILAKETFIGKGVHLVIEEKRQIIKKSGILELVPPEPGDLNDGLGGFKTLKDWLERKKKVLGNLSEATAFGVDLPKGFILAGMPGCGKSLCAKLTAQFLGLTLLRLDVGRLHGRYVGESEENMREALKLAEDISPCVLWVDELEKAFAGVQRGSAGSSDVTARLFGYFLTWLQDRKRPVFVVATANDLDSLPTELMRKGRFDDNFLVNFPTRDEALEILKIHLARRKQNPHGMSLNAIATKVAKDSFSGADIESLVSSAVETAFCEKAQKVSIKHLDSAKAAIKSMKQVFPARIEEFEKTFEDWKLTSVG
ncbi:MAG: AAA family ATPase [Rhodocyclaceae bacterium]|nr:AAA family ATPase [Rhodocyclaceae bacterium]